MSPSTVARRPSSREHGLISKTIQQDELTARLSRAARRELDQGATVDRLVRMAGGLSSLT
jgi:hypothetical protein